MPNVLDFLYDAGVATLVPLWLPLLGWTLLALPLYGLFRAWRGAHPFVPYAAYLAVLFALPVGLLAAALVDGSGLLFWSIGNAPETNGALLSTPLLLDTAASPSATPVWTWYHVAGLLTLAGALLAGFRLIVLVRQAASLRRARRHLVATGAALADTSMAQEASRAAGRAVRVFVTPGVSLPLTFGVWHPVILLPQVLAEEDVHLRMALAHESVHVRRYDYILQWIEEVIGAVFFIHPLVALLRRRIATGREMTCDEAVLHMAQCSPRAYAQLLYRFFQAPAMPQVYGLGMAEATHLKERIQAMKSFAHLNRFRYPRLVAAQVAVLTFLACAVTIVACTDLIDPDTRSETALQAEQAPPLAPRHDAGAGTEVFVIVEDMPELIGGLATIQQEIRYPAIAKKAGIEGRVYIQFIVDEQGNVVEPKVVRGIGGGCDEEAVRAVSKAKFKPGKQRGRAVKVKMSIPVTFRLGNSANLETILHSLDAEPQALTASYDAAMKAGDIDKVRTPFRKLRALEKTRHEALFQRYFQEGADVQRETSYTTVPLTGPVAAAGHTPFQVYVNGNLLREAVDYTVDHQARTVSIHNPA